MAPLLLPASLLLLASLLSLALPNYCCCQLLLLACTLAFLLYSIGGVVACVRAVAGIHTAFLLSPVSMLLQMSLLLASLLLLTYLMIY
jgi:hypothetical protein